jgi:hypothetical protein
MPIEFSEDLFQNDDFKVETDNNGDLVQTHKQTGAEFKFDSLKNRWVPVQGLDLGGATVDNVGSMDADSIDVTSLSATQLAQALDASGNDLNNVGAGDFDSVSSGSVSTGKQTLTGPRDESREIVASATDSDGSTNLSLSLSVSDPVECDVVLTITGNGDADSGDIEITVNGRTTGYQEVILQNGSLTGNTGQSNWSVTMFNTTQRRYRFKFTRGTNVDVSQVDGSKYAEEKLVEGNIDERNISTIEINTGFNATATAYVEAINDK